MIKKEFITIPLTELKPYANNPRINDNAVKDVIQSMKDCGNLDPKYCDVIIQRWENFTGQKTVPINE